MTDACAAGLDDETKKFLARGLFLQFYKKIMASERKRLGEGGFAQKRGALAGQFVTLLYAACAQIVLRASEPTIVRARGDFTEVPENQEIKFPWILKVLEIQPSDFPKVVDCVIKEESAVSFLSLLSFSLLPPLFLHFFTLGSTFPSLHSLLVS
jgi:hypothetical protein